jgi:predicted double-glycine peptidase
MEPLTPEQNNQIANWVVQRDAILLEISGLKTEQERLSKANKEIASSNVDIEQRIQQSIGRVSVMEEVEQVLGKKTNDEISDALIQKTSLESEIEGLKKVLNELTPQKNKLLKDIYLLTEVYNTVNDRVGVLDKVVDHVTKVSEQNKVVIDQMIESIKKSSQDIIDVNEKNVKEANVILDKLPRMIVELQKTKLIRTNL